MAGEFHHDIRRDAVGESEADEGLSACMSTNLGPLWIDVIVADTVAVQGDVDGRVEFTNLAEVLQAAVHLLVGHVREGAVAGERIVFVFVQDGKSILVEDDGKAVVGLLGGDGEDTVVDVGSADFNDVGITETGEGAEAEQIPCPGHAGGFFDNFLILVAIHVVQFEFGAVLGNLQGIELHQFILIEEDDGLFDNLEDRLVGLHVAQLGVSFADGPAEEPGEVLVLLHGGILLQATVGAKIGDEFLQAVLVVEVQPGVLLELNEMVFEGANHFHGFPAPLFDAALIADEFVHIVGGGLNLWLALLLFGLFHLLLGDFLGVVTADGGDFGGVLADCFLELLVHDFNGGLIVQCEVEVGELVLNVVDAGIDDTVVLTVHIDAAFLYLFRLDVPFLLADGVANEFLDTCAAHVDVRPDGALALFVEVAFLEIEPDLHLFPSFNG